MEERAKTIFGETPQNITPINFPNFDRLNEIENSPIWKKIIVGQANVDIAKLIQKLNLNDWVNYGRSYLHDDTCPFCQQQTITSDFKNKLESFFDETYLKDITIIKDLKQEYSLLIQNLIHVFNTIETQQKALKNTKLDVDIYSAHLKVLVSQQATNNELLNNKVKEPSRSIELVLLKGQLDKITEIISKAT